VWLHTRDRRILDLYGGHAVAGLGYGHPGWTRPSRPRRAGCNFQSNAVPMDVRARAATRLVDFAAGGYDSVFFVNSGAEANENALKMAFR
jgi:acetylornithine/N-succinyldiaminopimelate aminotransferase